MDKFNSVVFKLMKILSLMVLIGIGLDMMGYNTQNPESKAWDFFFKTAGVITMLWCISVVYLFFLIAFNEKVKNTVVRKLAGIRENDERETHLTGVISKKTFISMTGVLVLLLFLSSLKVNVYVASEEEVKQGKHGHLAIGMGLTLIAPEKNQNQSDELKRNYFFEYNGLPLTADGTLLFVIILQIGAFYYFSKNENTEIES